MSHSENSFTPPDDIRRIIRNRQSGVSQRETFLNQVTDDLSAIAIERASEPTEASTNTHPLVQISNLSFNYHHTQWRLPWNAPQFSPLALDNVSMTWKGPGIIMVAGRSGCGKSTLLRIVGGEQPFHKSQINGSLTFPGILPKHNSATHPSLNALTASRNLQRQLRAAASIMLVGSDDWGDDEYTRRQTLENVLFNSFSKITLLDEPLRLLDPREARTYEDRMKRIAEDGDRTFVVVTHDWRFIRVADHVVLMENGHVIIDDSAPAVLARGDLPNYVKRTLDNPAP